MERKNRAHSKASFHFPITVTVLLGIAACSAQNQYGQERLEDGLVDPFIRYPAIPSRILEARHRWVTATLNWVNQTLQDHPPSITPSSMRIQALAALDDPLHLGEAPIMAPIADYFQRRVETGLSHLESTSQVDTGAHIWKFYNFSFVVKTRNHTVAFDVSHGYRKVAMTPAQLRRLAEQVDVAFVSHDHPDHADVAFAHQMAALGKKVVIPETLWPQSDIEDSLVRVSGVFNGKAGGVSFLAYPGSQGSSIPNPVYLATVDNLRFMHMGDQSRGSDYENWIKGLGKKHDIDVLFINCRDGGMHKKISAIAPDLIIPGHENELRHIVDGRQGVVRTLSHLKDTKTPFVLMSWGEHYYHGPE